MEKKSKRLFIIYLFSLDMSAVNYPSVTSFDATASH